DRQEGVAPAAQRRRVARAEALDGGRGLLEVGPPLERVAASQEEGDVQLRLDVRRAVPLEIQVRVPGGLADRPMEERVHVVEEAGEAWVLDRRKAASRLVPALEAHGPKARPPEVGLQNEAVVAGAEEDAVVVGAHAPAMGRSASVRRSPARSTRWVCPSRRHSATKASGEAELNSNIS